MSHLSWFSEFIVAGDLTVATCFCRVATAQGHNDRRMTRKDTTVDSGSEREGRPDGVCCDDRVRLRTLIVDQIRKEAHMKAMVYHNYRSPDDVLELQDIDKPVVKGDEVLV